jgi:hypothetical protein
MRWWAEKVIMPIAVVLIGVGGTATGALLASPSAASISCAAVRQEVVQMYEMDKASINLDFPTDSPEVKECDINRFENGLRGS